MLLLNATSKLMEERGKLKTAPNGICVYLSYSDDDEDDDISAMTEDSIFLKEEEKEEHMAPSWIRQWISTL
jgi:hypothetical protein